MKLYVCAVLDKAVGAYTQPFYARSRGEALRSFLDACQEEKSQFRRHADDYVLMMLGSFDDNTGRFDTIEPLRLVSALECVMVDGGAQFGGAPAGDMPVATDVSSR